jgi:multicomponent Na+:H+ antiporter subunit E
MTTPRHDAGGGGMPPLGLLPVNLLIAVAWAFVAGSFDGVNLALGFAAGYLALHAFSEAFGGPAYHARMTAWARVWLWFAYDLVMSTWQVAVAVVTMNHRGRSRFVEVPLDVKSDLGIIMVANLITLTPGTLSVDVSDDRERLLIHGLIVDDPDALIADIKSGLETRVRAVAP